VQGPSQAGLTAPTGALNVGGLKLNIPKHAAHLLQQAFEAIKDVQASSTTQDSKPNPLEKKPSVQLETIEKLSKSTQVEEPESSQQAAHQINRKEGGGKVPYCFRCKTKGHAIESCDASMYCEICDSRDHLKPRFPNFRAVKLPTAPCGYAVEGL
jgi:hypothetical protein